MSRSKRIIIAMAAFLVVAGNTLAQYGGGDGSAPNPYIIRTAAELNSIGGNLADLDKHFRLEQDIDLSGIVNFNIIGKDGPPNYATDAFEGVFDGNGHTIFNLTINTSTNASEEGVGLFGTVGSTNFANIMNLKLVNVNVRGGGQFVGGLVGLLGMYSSISSCSVSGSVNGTFSVGGLVGLCVYNPSGSIIECHSSANVYGSHSPVGGLIGGNGFTGGTEGIGIISKCYATGNVTSNYGDGGTGGFIGFQRLGNISECYALGNVSGSGYHVGGFVGVHGGGSISNCYARGRVSGPSTVGGFVGYMPVGGQNISYSYSVGRVTTSNPLNNNIGGFSGGGGGDVYYSFWDIETSGQGADPHGWGSTTAEMQDPNIYLQAGWDFVGETANGTEDIWQIAEGVDYPVFKWQRLRVKLLSIQISGPSQVDEVSDSQYSCTAQYSDGSVPLASGEVTWAEDSAYASIDSSGQLSANFVSSDQPFQITATFEGISGTFDVTIVNLPVTADINGDGNVNYEDYAIIAENWMKVNQPGPNGDITDDGNVDHEDLAALAERWFELYQAIGLDIIFIDIPGGTSNMGSNVEGAWLSELPIHTVELSDFKMSKFEVTNAQYAKYLNDANADGLIEVRRGIVHASPRPSSYQPYFDTYSSNQNSQIVYSGGTFIVISRDGYSMANHPVVKVSWWGAKAFCDYYGYRLPTEAEWEYAGRGGFNDPYYKYPWGSSSIFSNRLNYNNNNPLGLSDFPHTNLCTPYYPFGYGLCGMAGNVSEWCADWYDPNYYSNSPVYNPNGPISGRYRVFRGGSWYLDAFYCRMGHRRFGEPNFRGIGLGFRPVQ